MGKDRSRKRSRSRSSSRSRSDSPDRKSSKKNYKERESRDEKMRRRLEKKALKRKQEQERSTICGYTDENNRFGDSNLTTQFRWHKKEESSEQEGRKVRRREDLSEKERRRQEAERKRAIEEEVEKVKRRREEREKEQAWMEEEKARMMRETEEQNHYQWEQKADQFHLEQSRLKSKIRLKEGRAKPIDTLAKNLVSDDTDVEMQAPYKLFKGLRLEQLEELQHDIAVHAGLDNEYRTFWEAMTIVCDDELEASRRHEAAGGFALVEGVDPAVAAELEKSFQDKSLRELEEQEDQVQECLDNGDDVDFYEHVLKRLVIAKAKARLKEIHEKILQRRLNSVEGKLALKAMNAPAPSSSGKSEPPKEERQVEQTSREESRPKAASDRNNGADETAKSAPAQPPAEPVQPASAPMPAAQGPPAMSGAEEAFIRNESNKGMEDDEEIFQNEVILDKQVHGWHNKYRPRKPRYFNRVHTGYEWNKYNQTHYDADNPPPKIVQGYKFNIFYPDLIDKTIAPTFKLENDSSPETKILRFLAGPPYEDIAFRVVAKEWEFSHKRGFKCTFDRGILHLYFNFKRYRYRR